MPTLLGIDSGRLAAVATFYKASELLGTGRYSEVYKAFDTHSHTDVALKLYTAFDNAAHDRARNEAALLAKLGALNSDYFPVLRRSVKHRIKNQNHPLLVLELGSYVGEDGQKRVISLRDVIPQSESNATSVEIAADFWCISSLTRWILHLVQAVKQLHSVNVVHRDIKPANILLKRGPGQSQAVPFLLDYNSASGAKESDSGSGTPRYLPPEVKLGKRVAPSPEDDLWAIAMVSWEMLFGQAAAPDKRRQQLAVIKGDVPESLVACISRALSVNPELRYRSADELAADLEGCLPAETQGGLVLRNNEVASARAEMDRIRRLIGHVFAPPGQIIVPKDIDDSVSTIFAWLSHEDSQALNLVDEIVKLGPAAIPACLQQGYRLQNKAASYDDVVVALGDLAVKDRGLADRSIDAYALSSNRGVRELCRRVCEELKYFPETLLTNLTSDEGLLLPEERLALADLCIRFSGESTATPALVKYMCREYVLDIGRYHDIREKVAGRMGEVQGSNTARAIWDACRARVWTELSDFNALQTAAKPEIERGLIELLADAFASTPDGGLQVLKFSKGQWNSGINQLPMFRRFAVKAGRRNADVRAWLINESTRMPGDRILQRIAKTFTEQREEKREDPKTILREYLKRGDNVLFNELRFLKDESLFDCLGSHLSGSCSSSDVNLILKLLRGFQNRSRSRVIDVLLRHWPKLSSHGYKVAAEILAAFPVPPGVKDEAVEVLSSDLTGANQVTARKALEQLLR